MMANRLYSEGTRKLFKFFQISTLVLLLSAGYLHYTEHPKAEDASTFATSLVIGFIGIAIFRAWRERPSRKN